MSDSAPSPDLIDDTPLQKVLAEYRARLDEQQREIQELRQSLQAKRSPTEVNALDHDCRCDDPEYDNGPAMNKLFADCGLKPGNHRTKIVFPGGFYYHKTPILFPKRTGLAVEGNGCGPGFTRQSYFGNSQHGGPRVTWLYTGDGRDAAGNTIAAVTVPSCGLWLNGINLQRGEWLQEKPPAEADGSVGLRVTSITGVPSSRSIFPMLTVAGFDVSIESARWQGSLVNNNSDNVHFGLLGLQNNNTAFRLANYQAVDWTIDHLMIDFQTNLVFDCVEVAHVTCQYMIINSDNFTLVRMAEPGNKRNPTSTNATMQLPWVKIDSKAKNWRILEQRDKCTFTLEARVELGKQHTLDEKLISLCDNTGHGRTVRVEAKQHGSFWNWQGGKFVPAADNPLGGAK